MANFGMMIDAMWEPGVLSRLAKAGALPEEVRIAAVKLIIKYSIDELDPAFGNPDLEDLFTNEEHESLLIRVREEVLPNLEQRIADYVWSIHGGLTAEEMYQTPRDYVDAIRTVFQENDDILKRCDLVEHYINDHAVDEEEDLEAASESSHLAAPERKNAWETSSGRDPFDDVAAGH